MTKYIIGLDIGTTSAKAVLFNLTGHVISECEKSYPLYHPHSGWKEQNPDEIEQAAIHAINQTLNKCHIQSNHIMAVGISAAMHSLICLNKYNEAISPSIIWADTRSTLQVEKLKKESGSEIYLKTGTPIHPMSPLAKLIWMKETQYQPYIDAEKFVSIKEYILLKWFGQTDVDYAIASATGLFNIHTFEWDNQALSLAGITKDQLSRPVPPTTTYRGLVATKAVEMGLPIDLPFVIGSSDGPLANLGIGAINQEDTAITIGTSGAIRQMVSKPKLDENQEVFCYAFTDNLWIMGGPTNNGAIVLNWLKDIFVEQQNKQGDIDAYADLTKQAGLAPPGSNGLLFLPYLNGERAPYWNAEAKGGYIGLTLSHNKQDMIRSGMEGVIFNLHTIGKSLDRLGGKSKNLLASGGFARSELWLQILADIFGKEVHVPETHQSSAWGAAWLALLALGEVHSLEEIKNFIPMKKNYLPNKKNHKTYQELNRLFEAVYKSMEPHFSELKIQNLNS